MTRLHASRLELLVDELPADADAGAAGRRFSLRAPAPGWFRPLVGIAAWCEPGTPIGTLDVLGRIHLLVVPPNIAGATEELPAADAPGGPSPGALSPRAVAYRDPIVRLSTQAVAAAAARSDAAAASSPAASTAGGLVFRAPTSGRFYGRSAPDKPPFVEPGTQLAHGATICLLEVMKTFHRVTYGGAGLPGTARVSSVLVRDGDDVNAGDPLLALE
jgi:acetyl-CoA carboxylase biotin carboxyl carrier protein